MTILHKITYRKAIILRYCFLTILIFNFISLYSQNEIKEKKLLKKARKDLVNERYDQAREKYLKLINIKPNDVVYNFETGLTYYFDNKEKLKSIPFFENAINNTKEDTIPQLFYYMGMAYHYQGKIDLSNTYLNIFRNYILTKTSDGRELVQHIEQIEENNYNHKKTDSVPNYKIVNLTGINSPYPDYAPILTPNKNYLVFTSRRPDGSKKKAWDLLPYENIYLAKKENGEWKLVTDKSEWNKFLPENINTEKHDAGVVYTTDGKTLYLYRKDQLWKSIVKESKWQEPFKLTKNIDYKHFHVPSAYLTKNSDTLYFSSSQKGGFGGKDLYYSIKKPDGSWSEGINLGPAINTVYDEDAPFLNTTGNVLYFSSKGHNSIGDFDIFKSVKNSDGSWSKPVNIGKPFNSPFNDIYYSINETQDTGFFASDRDGTIGAMDIWQYYFDCPNLKNVEIKGIAYNKTNHQPISATLVLINKESGDSSVFYAKPQTGEFLIVAEPQNDYILKIYAENYKPVTEEFTLPKQCDAYTNYLEFQYETYAENNVNYQKTTIYHSLYDAVGLANELKPDTNGLAKNTGINTSQLTNELQNILALHHLATIDTSKYNFYLTTHTKQLPQSMMVSIPEFKPVHFDFGKYKYLKSEEKYLDEVVEFFKSSDKKEDIRIQINGYTDAARNHPLARKILEARGIPYNKQNHEKYSKEFNLELSEKRAEYVAKYLIKKGIPQENIEIQAHGENNPVAPNVNNDGSDNPAGRALNRRVEIKIINKAIL
jgi:outer membrane protein OmpA-like peptidoglycan-associated protein